MKPLLLLAILVLSPSSPAGAQDACPDNATQTGLNECAADHLRSADERLNDLYADIRRRLAGDADRTALLLRAQRAWVAFRDAECALAASGAAGGSIQPMIVAGCLDRLTRTRIETFETYLSCPEGDPSCPVPPG